MSTQHIRWQDEQTTPRQQGLNSTLDPSLSMLDGTPSSIVTDHQLRILEATGCLESENVPTSNEVAVCFQTFDKCIPKLGAYQEVFKSVRARLFDAVYSKQVTVEQEKPVQIPYFVLLQRISSNRNEQAEGLQRQIKDLETQLSEKDVEIEKQLKAISEMRISLDKVEKVKEELEENVEKLDMDKHKLTKVISKLEEEVEDHQEEFKEAFENTEVVIADLQKEIHALEWYKKSFNRLDDAFTPPDLLKPKKQVSQPDMKLVSDEEKIFWKAKQLKNDIDNLNMLESQLLDLRNKTISEYDTYLDSRKEVLVAQHNSDASPFDELKWEKEDAKAQQDAQTLKAMQHRFTTNMQDVQTEVTLLSEQRHLLEKEIGKLQKKAEENKDQKTKNSEKPSDGLDLVKIMAGRNDDPFVPHEEILSRYSIMMYTSHNNGQSFIELPGQTMCQSCSNKTLICPHKCSQSERIIPLSRAATHIKITRPHLVVRELERVAIKDKDTSPAKLKRKVSKVRNFGEVTSLFAKKFPNHENVGPARDFTTEQILTIINEFYAYILWLDDNVVYEEDNVPSVLELFFRFISERYADEVAVTLTLRDIFSNLENMAPHNQDIMTFSLQLSGQIDASMFRYYLLMNDLIELFPWTNVKDMQVFVKIMYPFLTAEEIDQFRVGYITYSDNKITKELVSQYILQLIRTCRESRTMEVSSLLGQHVTLDDGYFTDLEFYEALEEIAPLCSEKLKRSLFAMCRKIHNANSDASLQQQTIPIQKAAEIASFLLLQQLKSELEDEIKFESIEREKTPSRMDSTRSTHSMYKGETSSDPIPSYSFLKKLGPEMAKRSRVVPTPDLPSL